jgi:hypothetical protein
MENCERKLKLDIGAVGSAKKVVIGAILNVTFYIIGER